MEVLPGLFFGEVYLRGSEDLALPTKLELSVCGVNEDGIDAVK